MLTFRSAISIMVKTGRRYKFNMAKMGRPKVASPRKVSAGFRMKEEDYEKLKRFASEHNLTQTEAIEQGLDLLYRQYQEAEL